MTVMHKGIKTFEELNSKIEENIGWKMLLYFENDYVLCKVKNVYNIGQNIHTANVQGVTRDEWTTQTLHSLYH